MTLYLLCLPGMSVSFQGSLCLLPDQAKCLLAGLLYSISKNEYTFEEATLG